MVRYRRARRPGNIDAECRAPDCNRYCQAPPRGGGRHPSAPTRRVPGADPWPGPGSGVTVERVNGSRHDGQLTVGSTTLPQACRKAGSVDPPADRPSGHPHGERDQDWHELFPCVCESVVVARRDDRDRAAGRRRHVR